MMETPVQQIIAGFEMAMRGSVSTFPYHAMEMMVEGVMVEELGTQETMVMTGTQETMVMTGTQET